jgi:flavin reductase (DIM6/NTAB) family NADH-FMN oxidoreductase RutF
MTDSDDTPSLAHPNHVRRALRDMAMPVTVLLIHDGTELRGMTATSVMPVSLSPPLLAVAVGHARWAYEVLKDGTECSLSVLGAGHEAHADHFGGSARRAAGVHTIKLGRTETDKPAVEGSIVTFVCTVGEHLEAGDHSVILLHVQEVDQDPDADVDPMLWFRGEPHYLDMTARD